MISYVKLYFRLPNRQKYRSIEIEEEMIKLQNQKEDASAQLLSLEQEMLTTQETLETSRRKLDLTYQQDMINAEARKKM